MDLIDSVGSSHLEEQFNALLYISSLHPHSGSAGGGEQLLEMSEGPQPRPIVRFPLHLPSLVMRDQVGGRRAGVEAVQELHRPGGEVGVRGGVPPVLPGLHQLHQGGRGQAPVLLQGLWQSGSDWC